jgi:hypothetical protein
MPSPLWSYTPSLVTSTHWRATKSMPTDPVETRFPWVLPVLEFQSWTAAMSAPRPFDNAWLVVWPEEQKEITAAHEAAAETRPCMRVDRAAARGEPHTPLRQV